MATKMIMSRSTKAMISSPMGSLPRSSEGRATMAVSNFTKSKKRSSLNMMEQTQPKPATAGLFNLLQSEEASDVSSKRFKCTSGPSFEVTDLFSGLLGDHEAEFPSIEWNFDQDEKEAAPKAAPLVLPRSRSGGLVRSKAFSSSSQQARLC